LAAAAVRAGDGLHLHRCWDVRHAVHDIAQPGNLNPGDRICGRVYCDYSVNYGATSLNNRVAVQKDLAARVREQWFDGLAALGAFNERQMDSIGNLEMGGITPNAAEITTAQSTVVCRQQIENCIVQRYVRGGPNRISRPRTSVRSLIRWTQADAADSVRGQPTNLRGA
jgi:hypothetical protein